MFVRRLVRAARCACDAMPFVATLAMLVFLGTPTVSSAQSFGATAFVDGDRVGFAEPESRLRPGTMRLFTGNEAGEWTQTGELRASDGSPGDGFGTAIARDGDRLLVGAPGADDDRGAAYVFERRDDGSWEQVAKLTAPETEAGEGLGFGVALEGDLALVALDDGKLLSTAAMVEQMIGPAATHREPGAVHAFRFDADGWRHTGRFRPDEQAAGVGLGSAMALRDGVAYVGAAHASPRSAFPRTTSGPARARCSPGGTADGASPDGRWARWTKWPP